MNTAAVILAAGAGSRFGGAKLRAPLHGVPLLRRVVDTARQAGLDPIVVMVPPTDDFDDLDLGEVRRIVNPRPEEGLSSSVRLGLRAVEHNADVDAAVILLGDQPTTRPEVLDQVLAAGRAPEAPGLIAPRYSGDGAPNPVLANRSAWRLADELVGDRGFGPLLDDRPDLVGWVAVHGANPDIDTPADLVGVLEGEWAERVRANRAQVDEVREVPDRDFYAPVSSLFVADPRRTGDEALDVLFRLARPDDTWLDIGAGAGRYALPLAQRVSRVIAVEPSASMRNALRTGRSEHGLDTLDVVAGVWPAALADLGHPPVADVALIAHVGYDIEAIGPFLDAMEIAASRLCVAMLTDHSPASVADPFWPIVHERERVPLPALPELVELLRARGRTVEVERVERAPRTFDSRDSLATFVRRQLWIRDDGARNARFQAALTEMSHEVNGGWTLRTPPVGSVGIVTWAPPS